MRKVAVFTGTRAEYGLLYWLLKDLDTDIECDLQVIVSGSHLSPEFGNTVDVIKKDGFEVQGSVEMLLSSDSSVGVVKGMGVGLIGYADTLARLQPDMIVILGDRFEAFAAAQAAMLMRIPVVHLHGGEITEGAYDDAIRHAITKLSYLHCTSTEDYRRRVIQLGESPERVYNVGAIGLDHLKRSRLMSLNELALSLNFALASPYFLVTYHPVTLANENPEESFNNLKNGLNEFPNHQVIITYPNADDGGRKIIPLIEEYAAENPGRVLAIKSLGQVRYLSAVKYAESVIGNSSSGIIEVPSFCVPTVDIGERQKGRLAAESVIHCETDKNSIVSAIKKAEILKSRSDYSVFNNPYGDGDTSSKVLELVKSVDLSAIKSFYDLEVRK